MLKTAARLHFDRAYAISLHILCIMWLLFYEDTIERARGRISENGIIYVVIMYVIMSVALWQVPCAAAAAAFKRA